MNGATQAASRAGDGQTPSGTLDLVGEIAAMAENPEAASDEILARLQLLAETFAPDEVFAVLIRFDTPDVLG